MIIFVILVTLIIIYAYTRPAATPVPGSMLQGLTEMGIGLGLAH